MRIALVSAEYVGRAVSGGIGTYMRNAAHMLAGRGHDVEVFAAGRETTHYREPDGTRVNLVQLEDRGAFAGTIVPLFLARNGEKPFDVIEGAEFLAETSRISDLAPEIPLVLKLHTPSTMMLAMGHHFVPFTGKARFIVGSLLRGKLSAPYWVYDPDRDHERQNLLRATEITAPCRAITKAVGAIWRMNLDHVPVIPNVFTPPKVLLDVPVDTRTGVVTFIGRLEMRKGVFDFAEAIPLVLREFKTARFRFVGRSMPHPGTGKDIRAMIERRLKPVAGSIEFVDGVAYDQVHRYFAAADICVLPSIWENFPNVCLEAMSAARGIVGSSAGGMSEMLEHGRTGLLVPPRDPKAIADAILALLRSPERRMAMGLAARAHVTSAYSCDVIGPLQEASYEQAIRRARPPLGRAASAA